MWMMDSGCLGCLGGNEYVRVGGEGEGAFGWGSELKSVEGFWKTEAEMACWTVGQYSSHSLLGDS